MRHLRVIRAMPLLLLPALVSPAMADCTAEGDAAAAEADFEGAARAYERAAARPECRSIRGLLLLNAIMAAAEAGGAPAEPCTMRDRLDEALAVGLSARLAPAARREREAADARCVARRAAEEPPVAVEPPPSAPPVSQLARAPAPVIEAPGLAPAPTARRARSTPWLLGAGGAVALVGSAVSYGLALHWQDEREAADAAYASARSPVERDRALATREDALDHVRGFGVTAYALAGTAVALGVWSVVSALGGEPAPALVAAVDGEAAR